MMEAVKARNDEARQAVIGFDHVGRMLYVVHVVVEEDCILIVSARQAGPKKNDSMLTDTLKERLDKDRRVTSITLRIPVDVVDSLKAIAPHKGLGGYQTLLKAYISEGLRRDEAMRDVAARS